MMAKVLEINDSGYVWEIPLDAIARHRARYYADRDADASYEEEFSLAMQDHSEALDWFLNNMDFEDVADKATLIRSPAPLAAPRMNTDNCQTRVAIR